jgi:hypothetical protein
VRMTNVTQDSPSPASLHGPEESGELPVHDMLFCFLQEKEHAFSLLLKVHLSRQIMLVLP